VPREALASEGRRPISDERKREIAAEVGLAPEWSKELRDGDGEQLYMRSSSSRS
jgi:hypothetical protein